MSSFREINSDIIIRYLEGKLTGEEKAFLVEWLEKIRRTVISCLG